ncbi:MAG TPA: hypothetical protein VEW48_01660 [Thermoanaerobaculia bacterium]|nr:hypothetical protein [Thermoanaerobaculia bacterium]
MESIAGIAVAPRAARAAVLPWPLRALLLGSTSIVVGLLWDISWHMSIGRDTFWTPAHMAIYLGGVLAGLSGGWMVLRTTFRGTPEERAVAVRFWGFRGPLGAWVAIWGALAMLTSAPFDDWWHSSYGLDVKIISPPHSVLAAGMIAIQVGAMLLALAWQNRAPEERARPLELAFLYCAGVILLMVATMLSEYVYPNNQHAATFYKVTAAVFPVLLVAVARASRLRWAATITSGFYMAVALVLVWVLPLFPAQPRLAPINNPIDHMVPPLFPMLLVVPALALDLVFLVASRPAKRSRWWLAPVLAAAFVAVFFVTQWSFSSFQLSPASRNRLFAGDMQWSYSKTPGSWRHELWEAKENPVTPGKLGKAWLLASVSSLVGLGWGSWMARVKR